MNSQPIEKASVYCFSIFRMEVAERRLWCEDVLISLTPKQFDLLAYFVENAGRIAKKSDLLDAVWADAYIEEATLARNVSWLRSKLEEHAAGETFIETVPKLGYRFTAKLTRATADPAVLGSETQTALAIRGEETIHFDDAAIAEQEEKESPEAGETTELQKLHVPSRGRPLALFALLFIVIAGVAITGSSYLRSRNTPQTDTQTPDTAAQAAALRVNATITIKNIAVDATEQAIEAGIRVLPGDTIMVGAEGLHQTGTGQTFTVVGDKTAKVSGNYTFQQADPSSLVGWVGTTEADQTDYFQVSKGSPITANKSGFLYFAINDWRHEYANNRGGLLVAVTLNRTFEISAEENDVQAAWGNGLVMLHKDDTLAVTSAGTVSYWAGGELYDLNGSTHKLEGLLAPAINARSFIGKIGSRNPFKLGMNYPQQRVAANGWLFISVNDQIARRGAFKNNSGHISVGIEVVRSPEAFTKPI